MKNKKGFTLIELLAVIIILGILMIIAIPSVTKYISDSRKSAYVDTAKEIVGGARNLVNEGKLEMYDTDTTYYIESSCIKTENALKSPYGDFTKAYVVVTYDGKGYDYYWTSVDDAGQGIKNIIRVDKLDTDNIESDLKETDISTLRGIDGRSNTVVVSKQNNCQKEGANDAGPQVNGETGEERNPIEYPEGKDKSTVTTGEILKIGTEEFYLMKKEGKHFTLLSRYNINVGSHKNPNVPEGRQDVSVQGYKDDRPSYGGLPYSNSLYWAGKIGEGKTYPGNYCTYQSHVDCADIYDRNVLSYNYISQYGEYIRSFGVNVTKARMIKYDEFHQYMSNVSGGSVILCSISYWISSVPNDQSVYSVNGCMDSRPGCCYTAAYNFYYYDNAYGVRPIIEIDA